MGQERQKASRECYRAQRYSYRTAALGGFSFLSRPTAPDHNSGSALPGTWARERAPVAR
jgi:hypothetical protein